MKLLVVLAAVTALCAGSAIPAIPVIPGDNSHYVEGESRYIWMPDGEGVPHLVDLEEPVVQSETRSGEDNEYWLYTRDNPTNPQVIVHGDANSLLNSNYRSDRPLKVVVHGWNGNGNSASSAVVLSAFLDVQDCNVISVDWREASTGIYSPAVSRVPSVGQFAGEFLVWLIDTAGGDWNKVHLIGFSLGAQVVGFMGRTTGSRPARITGLDPAGPLWTSSPNALNSNDGQYVESIHTDGGLLGIFIHICDADFYPNGGRHPQLGCTNSNCSHQLAHSFMASSIRTNHFISRLCDNINQVSNPDQCAPSVFRMGNGDISKRGSGIYALTTANEWPF